MAVPADPKQRALEAAEQEYQSDLAALNQNFPGQQGGDYEMALVLLISAYEERVWTINRRFAKDALEEKAGDRQDRNFALPCVPGGPSSKQDLPGPAESPSSSSRRGRSRSPQGRGGIFDLPSTPGGPLSAAAMPHVEGVTVAVPPQPPRRLLRFAVGQPGIARAVPEAVSRKNLFSRPLGYRARGLEEWLRRELEPDVLVPEMENRRFVSRFIDRMRSIQSRDVLFAAGTAAAILALYKIKVENYSLSGER